MQVDVMTTPRPLREIGDLARRTQAAHFSGMLFTETGRTAYLNAAVAAQAAPGLEFSTGVAVAFPRSPFVTAATAWELQEATGGKFRLGLGKKVWKKLSNMTSLLKKKLLLIFLPKASVSCVTRSTKFLMLVDKEMLGVGRHALRGLS